MSLLKSVMALVLVMGCSLTAFAGGDFPTNPDSNLTPGSLCNRPNSYRYPEKIPYCTRNVDTRLKREIFQDYNQKLGYHIDMSKRNQFKIDHLIPLCAGGSNNRDNLWPQHSSVYRHTDEMEMVACEKMADGRVTQRRAIDLILEAKKDLSKAAAILAQFKAM
ncbi:hypothetical protein D3C87_87440 [compost metagenome]